MKKKKLRSIARDLQHKCFEQFDEIKLLKAKLESEKLDFLIFRMRNGVFKSEKRAQDFCKYLAYDKNGVFYTSDMKRTNDIEKARHFTNDEYNRIKASNPEIYFIEVGYYFEAEYFKLKDKSPKYDIMEYRKLLLDEFKKQLLEEFYVNEDVNKELKAVLSTLK